MRELSAREKATVFRIAKDHLKAKEGSTRLPHAREAVAAALAECGYWFSGLGTKREKTTSIEIAVALGLDKNLPAVNEWGRRSSREQISTGFDKVVEYLQ